jgi:hypothetical protein
MLSVLACIHNPNYKGGIHTQEDHDLRQILGKIDLAEK